MCPNLAPSPVVSCGVIKRPVFNHKSMVSLTVIDWKMYTFRLGSHVSLLSFFLFENRFGSRTESFLFRIFRFKTELFEL